MELNKIGTCVFFLIYPLDISSWFTRLLDYSYLFVLVESALMSLFSFCGFLSHLMIYLITTPSRIPAHSYTQTLSQQPPLIPTHPPTLGTDPVTNLDWSHAMRFIAWKFIADNGPPNACLSYVVNGFHRVFTLQVRETYFLVLLRPCMIRFQHAVHNTLISCCS